MFNLRTSIVEEFVHVSFNKNTPKRSGKVVIVMMFHVLTKALLNDYDPKDGPSKSKDIKIYIKEREEDDGKQDISTKLTQKWSNTENHSINNILENIKKGISMIPKLINFITIPHSSLKFNQKTFVWPGMMKVGSFIYKKKSINLKEKDVWELISLLQNKNYHRHQMDH